MANLNRYIVAFKEHANVVGLSSAVALSAALLNPLPLLVGLVAEAAYLIFVPDSKWYESRLSRKHDAEVVARRAQLKARVLPLLAPEMLERFSRLEVCRVRIGQVPVDRAAGSGDQWFREVLRKLDYLLEKFLMFASKEVEFRRHLQSVADEARGAPPHRSGGDVRLFEMRKGRTVRAGTGKTPERSGDGPGLDPATRWIQDTVSDVQARYDLDMTQIRELQANEPDENTKAVLGKRLDVLKRRHEGIGKIGKILTNLNHQLELLEDTFGLINDEIRARSPEQVLSEIEDVVFQTESMTQLLEEMAPYEQLVARLSG